VELINGGLQSEAGSQSGGGGNGEEQRVSSWWDGVSCYVVTTVRRGINMEIFLCVRWDRGGGGWVGGERGGGEL